MLEENYGEVGKAKWSWKFIIEASHFQYRIWKVKSQRMVNGN